MTRLCVFDAYGTLFDVAGAARQAAAEPGGGVLADIWPGLAEDWRRKQLEYSWLRAVTGDYKPFRAVTEDALDWALETAGVSDPALRETLMALYDALPAYPEVPQVLDTLRGSGIACAILSNGSPDMLQAAVDSAGLAARLDAILSVDAVQTFKPARAVYDRVGAHFGTAPEAVTFVSSNGWDVAGAAAYGFRTVWVNRAGVAQDRLMAAPGRVLPDLSGLPGVL